MFTSLGKKSQFEKHNTSKPNRFGTIPPHALVSCTSSVLRHRRRSWLCRSTEGSAIDLFRMSAPVRPGARYLMAHRRQAQPAAAGPGHGSMHFLASIGPFASCFICSEVQLPWIFFLWLCFGIPVHSYKINEFPRRDPKKCHYETAEKVNVQVGRITWPSPVDAPFMCSGLPVSLPGFADWPCK